MCGSLLGGLTSPHRGTGPLCPVLFCPDHPQTFLCMLLFALTNRISPHQMLNNNELISATPKQVAADFAPTFSAGKGEQALWASFPLGIEGVGPGMCRGWGDEPCPRGWDQQEQGFACGHWVSCFSRGCGRIRDINS